MGRNMSKQCKRVLQIIRTMNIGGAETLIMNIYRNIDRNQIQFDFLVNGEGKYDDEIRQLGGRIYLIPYLTEVGQFKYVKELKDFFKEHPEYTTIHSHIDQVSGIIVETAKKSGVPVVISHSHNTQNSNNILGKIYKSYLQSKINKNTDIKLACGEDAAKWLYKNEASDAIIIKNGIDTEKFFFSYENREKIRSELNISDETVVIGHVGRFSKQKNHKFLIDIFYEYQKVTSDSRLVLVGDGELRKEIEEQIGKLGLAEKVILLGIRKDINEIYSAFDFFVFPSLYEGLSLVSIEAQSSGLKILASDTIDHACNITENITFMGLEKSANVWAEHICKTPLEDRSKVKERIVNSGYDIKNTVNKIEKIYLEN